MLAPSRMLCCTEYLTPSSARKLAGAHCAPVRQKRNFLTHNQTAHQHKANHTLYAGGLVFFLFAAYSLG